jgi:hypothetical protein
VGMGWDVRGEAIACLVMRGGSWLLGSFRVTSVLKNETRLGQPSCELTSSKTNFHMNDGPYTRQFTSYTWKYERMSIA